MQTARILEKYFSIEEIIRNYLSIDKIIIKYLSIEKILFQIRIPLIPRRIQDGNGLKNNAFEEDNDNDNERNKPVADHKEVTQTDFDFFVTWSELLTPGMAVILFMFL